MKQFKKVPTVKLYLYYPYFVCISVNRVFKKCSRGPANLRTTMLGRVNFKNNQM